MSDAPDTTTAPSNQPDAPVPDAGSSPAGSPPVAPGSANSSDAGGGDGPDRGGAPAGPARPSSDVPEDWKTRRLGVMTARAKEMAERAESYRTQLEALQAKEGGGQAPAANAPAAGAPSQAEFDRRVAETAARQIAVQKFNDDCKNMVKQGEGLYKDFNEKIQILGAQVDPTDTDAMTRYANLIAATIQTGSRAPSVLYNLGSNPKEAERIMGLDPVRQAVELVKLASGESEPTTQAPKPITPINGGGRGDSIDPSDPSKSDKLSTKEWMERRNKQIADKRKTA